MQPTTRLFKLHRRSSPLLTKQCYRSTNIATAQQVAWNLRINKIRCSTQRWRITEGLHKILYRLYWWSVTLNSCFWLFEKFVSVVNDPFAEVTFIHGNINLSTFGRGRHGGHTLWSSGGRWESAAFVLIIYARSEAERRAAPRGTHRQPDCILSQRCGLRLNPPPSHTTDSWEYKVVLPWSGPRTPTIIKFGSTTTTLTSLQEQLPFQVFTYLWTGVWIAREPLQLRQQERRQYGILTSPSQSAVWIIWDFQRPLVLRKVGNRIKNLFMYSRYTRRDCESFLEWFVLSSEPFQYCNNNEPF